MFSHILYICWFLASQLPCGAFALWASEISVSTQFVEFIVLKTKICKTFSSNMSFLRNVCTLSGKTNCWSLISVLRNWKPDSVSWNLCEDTRWEVCFFLNLRWLNWPPVWLSLIQNRLRARQDKCGVKMMISDVSTTPRVPALAVPAFTWTSRSLTYMTWQFGANITRALSGCVYWNMTGTCDILTDITRWTAPVTDWDYALLSISSRPPCTRCVIMYAAWKHGVTDRKVTRHRL